MQREMAVFVSPFWERRNSEANYKSRYFKGRSGFRNPIENDWRNKIYSYKLSFLEMRKKINGKS